MDPGTIIAGVTLGLFLLGGSRKKKKADDPDKPPPPQIDPVPENPDDPEDPVVVFQSLVSPVPAFGRLWQPTPQLSSAIGASASLLGLPATDPMVQHYARNLLPASAWNWFLYAVEAEGAYSYVYPNTNVRGYPYAAFFPFNDDVGAAVAADELPFRRYAFGRTKNPNTGNFKPPVLKNNAPQHGIRGYGYLFFPPNEPGHPDDADRNPTELLASLGKTVQDLHGVV